MRQTFRSAQPIKWSPNYHELRNGERVGTFPNEKGNVSPGGIKKTVALYFHEKEKKRL